MADPAQDARPRRVHLALGAPLSPCTVCGAGAKTSAWETDVPHDFMGPYREALSLKVKTHFA